MLIYSIFQFKFVTGVAQVMDDSLFVFFVEGDKDKDVFCKHFPFAHFVLKLKMTH